MKKIFILIFTILQLNSFSQEQCLSYKVIQDQIANAINPQVIIDEFETLKNTQFIPTKAGNVITIPIVFHVIHNGDLIGENENLSDSIILEQLKRINIDFRAQSFDTANIPNEFILFLGDAEIEFCLAKKDTSGNFTTGIIHHNLGQTGWNENGINDTVKPATIWDRDNYLNVWTFNFAGNLATNNVNGYATPPFSSTDANKDGVVLNYTKVGNDLTNDIGRILVHEIGHWLGLLHIWGDDIGACTGDDGIADTPNQGAAYQGCPSGIPNTCGSNDMYVNYMDYTDADCSLMFTTDQTNKMLSILNGFRASLLNSDKCTVSKDLVIEEIIYPNGSICQESFIPIIKIKNIGNQLINKYGFELFIDNISQESFLNNLDIAPGETKYVQGNLINDNSNTLKEVKFVVQSGENDEYNLNNEKIAFYNTINTGNGFTDLAYDFEENTFPPNNLFIQNEGNDTTWSKYNGNITSLTMIHNSIVTVGQLDAFTTTDFNFSDYLGLLPLFSFNYFYNAKPNLSDTLTVFYSLDCGVHWVPFWSKEGLSLSNGETSNSLIDYTDQDLQTMAIHLSAIFGDNAGGFKKIRFKFENKSGGGNNIYIDNINLSLPIDITDINISQIKIFPNPSSNFITISQEKSSSLTIELMNISGKLLIKKTLSSTTESLSIKEFTKGVYFIKISNKANSYIKKIIKN